MVQIKKWRFWRKSGILVFDTDNLPDIQAAVSCTGDFALEMSVVMAVKPEGWLDGFQNFVQIAAGFQYLLPGSVAHMMFSHRSRSKRQGRFMRHNDVRGFGEAFGDLRRASPSHQMRFDEPNLIRASFCMRRDFRVSGSTRSMSVETAPPMG